MLKIILGSDYAEEKLGIHVMYGIESVFKASKKKEWFRDDFVKKIISDIDNADVILDFSIYSRMYETGYSVDSLSAGAMSLIMAYEKPELNIVLRMGDNCTDLLEQIVSKYDKQGKDITIICNYMHMFNFRYIDKIKYVNWGITCKSRADIVNKVMDKWYKQENPDWDQKKREDSSND